MIAKDTYKYLSLIVVALLTMTACTNDNDSPFAGERALSFAVGSVPPPLCHTPEAISE